MHHRNFHICRYVRLVSQAFAGCTASLQPLCLCLSALLVSSFPQRNYAVVHCERPTHTASLFCWSGAISAHVSNLVTAPGMAFFSPHFVGSISSAPSLCVVCGAATKRAVVSLLCFLSLHIAADIPFGATFALGSLFCAWASLGCQERWSTPQVPSIASETHQKRRVVRPRLLTFGRATSRRKAKTRCVCVCVFVWT